MQTSHIHSIVAYEMEDVNLPYASTAAHSQLSHDHVQGLAGAKRKRDTPASTTGSETHEEEPNLKKAKYDESRASSQAAALQDSAHAHPHTMELDDTVQQQPTPATDQDDDMAELQEERTHEMNKDHNAELQEPADMMDLDNEVLREPDQNGDAALQEPTPTNDQNDNTASQDSTLTTLDSDTALQVPTPMMQAGDAAPQEPTHTMDKNSDTAAQEPPHAPDQNNGDTEVLEELQRRWEAHIQLAPTGFRWKRPDDDPQGRPTRQSHRYAVRQPGEVVDIEGTWHLEQEDTSRLQILTVDQVASHVFQEHKSAFRPFRGRGAWMKAFRASYVGATKEDLNFLLQALDEVRGEPSRKPSRKTPASQKAGKSQPGTTVKKSRPKPRSRSRQFSPEEMSEDDEDVPASKEAGVSPPRLTSRQYRLQEMNKAREAGISQPGPSVQQSGPKPRPSGRQSKLKGMDKDQKDVPASHEAVASQPERSVKASRSKAKAGSRQRVSQPAPTAKQYGPELTPSRQSRLKEMDKAQEDLFKHPRRFQLEQAWKDHKDDDTLFAEWAPVGTHLLQGMPAKCSPESESERDFDLMNMSELSDFLRNMTEMKRCIVLRGTETTEWQDARSSQTSQEFLDQLLVRPEEMIDVQNFERTDKFKTLPMQMEAQTAVNRVRDCKGELTPKALNMLSFNGSDGALPLPLLKYCNLLNQASAKLSGNSKTISNPAAVEPAVDIHSCTKFEIFGQAGAISYYHLDSIAPITTVVLERDSNSTDESEVLKYWPIIRLDLLSQKKREKELESFAKLREDWRPDPSLIRIISLRQGDVLIMPPGVIHAPITMTDCYFKGGMFMDRRIFIKQTLPNWKYISENPNITNELPARQTRALLDWIIQEIRQLPHLYGLQPEEVEEHVKTCLGIADRSLKCNCGSKAKEGTELCRIGRCLCARYWQRCGSLCNCEAKQNCLNTERSEEEPEI